MLSHIVEKRFVYPVSSAIVLLDTDEKGDVFMRMIRAGIHFYIFGILLITLGIALTIQSRLGTSPFDSLLVGLYRTFGLTIGSWEIVIGLIMVLFNALAERKRPEYYALLTSLITGVGIDFWVFVLRDWVVPETWIGQFVCVMAGIVIMCIGVATYLQSTLAPNPMDRSMLVVSKLTGWGVSYARALINVILVIVAFFLDGAIGIGTLINALISGSIIGFFLPHLQGFRNKFHRQRDDLVS